MQKIVLPIMVGIIVLVVNLTFEYFGLPHSYLVQGPIAFCAYWIAYFVCGHFQQHQSAS